MELKVQTPCLLTCIKELNTPRYMRAFPVSSSATTSRLRSLITTL